MNVMTRFAVWMLAQALLTSAILAASPARAAADCGPVQFQDERLDVNSPKDQRRISEVEFNHFNANVENLVSGMSGSVGGGTPFRGALIRPIITGHWQRSFDWP